MARGALPPRTGQVVAAGPLQVPGDLGRSGGAVGRRAAGLDGERDGEVCSLGVAQVGAGGLGQQRVAVAQPAPRPAGQPRVEDLPLGVGGGRQRGDLRGCERPPGGRDRFRQGPRRLRQPAQCGSDYGAQAAGRRAAAGRRGAGALHGEQRVPLGCGHHVVDDRAGQHVAGDAADDLGDLRSAERSTFLCVPNALSQEGGYALGAQAGEAAIREVVTEAGFTRFRRAAETPFNNVFEARP